MQITPTQRHDDRTDDLILAKFSVCLQTFFSVFKPRAAI